MTVRLTGTGDGDTPRRTIRVPDEEWKAAQRVARQRGDKLSEVIRSGLRRYVSRHSRDTQNEGGPHA